MAKEGKKAWLSDIVEANRVCRDYTYQRERYWWGWFLCISIPLMVIVTVQNVAAEFGYGNSHISWWLLVLLSVALVSCRIGLVWLLQRERKHYEERMAFHQQKIREGFTYLVVENGEQKFYR